MQKVVAARDTTDDHTATAAEVAEFVRSFASVDPGARPAAVLVLLFEEDGEARVLLTVRSAELRYHQGEVAFPGGRLDTGETVVEGALREAREEVGLDRSGITVLGQLTAMPTVSSNTLMVPVVAVAAARPTVDPAPAEVAAVFDVALRELVADGVFAEELWAVPGRIGTGGVEGAEFPVWFYSAGGQTIWGATARVLTDLLCLVLGVPSPARRVPH